MRRALLAMTTAIAAVPLLAACGGGSSPSSRGPAHVDVSGHGLAAYKKQTSIPDCPMVTKQQASGGMPSVTLPCLGGGRAVDVAGLRGPMIVNFWASWCGDCREEMPALASYARSHRDVKVLGIDYLDPQPGAALELARKSHVDYPLVADPSGALDHQSPLPHISGLPFTAFVNADGKVVHVLAGAMLTQDDVATDAHRYLGVAG
jgi:thiol-disulfide isomerase/thioredoxin